MRHRPLWLIAAPALFLLLWSAGFAVAKIGVRHAEPLTLLAWRYGLAVAALLPTLAILRPPLPATRRAWADIAITGFFIQVVYFSLCYFAFRSGMSAGGLSIIVCLQPILVALIAPHFVGETVGPGRWLGLALGMAGAATVILARSEVAAAPLRTQVFMTIPTPEFPTAFASITRSKWSGWISRRFTSSASCGCWPTSGPTSLVRIPPTKVSTASALTLGTAQGFAFPAPTRTAVET